MSGHDYDDKDMTINALTNNNTKKSKTQEARWNYILVQNGVSYPFPSDPFVDAKYIKSQWAKIPGSD